LGKFRERSGHALMIFERTSMGRGSEQKAVDLLARSNIQFTVRVGKEEGLHLVGFQRADLSFERVGGGCWEWLQCQQRIGPGNGRGQGMPRKGV
jgi:hypothetical protein